MDAALPGHELIDEGAQDLRDGAGDDRGAIGAPRLSRAGVRLPPELPKNPEHPLYEILAASEPDSAHSRYNALVRRLVNFERAAEISSL